METVEMLVQEETRRRVSVDFTLSDDRAKALQTDGGVVVPISVLSKQPRRNFDLRDEGGRAVPVLGRRDNGDLALLAVLSAILEAVPAGTSDANLQQLADETARVVLADEVEASDALWSFHEAAEGSLQETVWADPDCRQLLRTLALNYVLFAVLPADAAGRRILKYSYGEEIPRLEPLGWRTRLRQITEDGDAELFVVNCPGAWRAASFHMEIAVAEELRIAFAGLLDADTDGDLGEPDFDVNRAALYAADAIAVGADVRCLMMVMPERDAGAMRAAGWAVATAGLLWAGWFSGLDARNPGAAVSLLLAGVALVSNFTSRRDQHAIVRRVFRNRHRALAVITVVGLIGSASLALELPSARPLCVWLAAAVVASLATISLVRSAVRAAK